MVNNMSVAHPSSRVRGEAQTKQHFLHGHTGAHVLGRWVCAAAKPWVCLMLAFLSIPQSKAKFAAIRLFTPSLLSVFDTLDGDPSLVRFTGGWLWCFLGSLEWTHHACLHRACAPADSLANV